MKIHPACLALLLAGCAPAATPQPADRALARELAGRVAGPTRDCINASLARGLRVIDRETVVYEEGATLWVNRLHDRCPGLDPLDTLLVEIRSGRYCRGDQVSGLEPGSSVPGPSCILGTFTPYRRPR